MVVHEILCSRGQTIWNGVIIQPNFRGIHQIKMLVGNRTNIQHPKEWPLKLWPLWQQNGTVFFFFYRYAEIAVAHWPSEILVAMVLNQSKRVISK